MSRRRVSTSDHLTGDHKWGIVTFGTNYTPGDERSRTHPGHGYPESWVPGSLYFDAYTDEEEWKEDIAELTLSGERFRAFTMQHVSVSTTVNVEVS